MGTDLVRAQAVFDALASPVRREILWLTRSEELSAGEIGRHFDKSAATLSSHLAVLKASGLITVRSDGNFRRYRCNVETVAALVPLLAADGDRWVPADDIPESGHARVTHSPSVVVEVDVDVPPLAAYTAFVDESQYQAWLGVAVTIRDGHFRATLEWGTEIRGTYEVMSAPSLLAMRWDFDDANVPLPGRELLAYLRFEALGTGSRVIAQQFANDEQQALFLATAWSLVLGRFASAYRGDSMTAPRARRAKRRA